MCLPVVPFDDLPVLGGPIRATDERLLDRRPEPALGADRYRQPADSLAGFDLVSISPVVAGVLHVIEENELVDASDQIEIAFPGDIVGLKNGDPFGHVQPTES